MAFDTEQQPPSFPPPAPEAPQAPYAPPMPPSFAFGAGSSSRRVNTKAVALLGAVVVAGGAFYAWTSLGGDEPAAVQPIATKPKAAAPKNTPSNDPRVLASVLRNLATAEESYATDHDGRYTTKMSLLETEGFATEQGVKASVVHAGDMTKGYCLKAAGAKTVLYYSSATGTVSKKSC